MNDAVDEEWDAIVKVRVNQDKFRDGLLKRHYVMHKLNHGENVTTDVLGKICKALDCTLDDIMEFTDEE